MIEELRPESEMTDEQRAAMETILAAIPPWLTRAMAALETPEGSLMERFNQVMSFVAALDEGASLAAQRAGIQEWVSGRYSDEANPMAFVESLEEPDELGASPVP